MFVNRITPEEINRALRVEPLTPDIRVERGVNGEVLIGTRFGDKKRCFVLRQTEISSCNFCDVIAVASPVVERSGRLNVRCCETVRVKFLYLTLEELSCLPFFSCQDHKANTGGGTTSIDGEVCICSDENSSDPCEKCFIFCAELNTETGLYETTWQMNPLQIMKSTEHISGLLEACQNNPVSVEEFGERIVLSTDKCKEWCLEATIAGSNDGPVIITLKDSSGVEICREELEDSDELQCVYCCFDAPRSTPFMAVYLDIEGPVSYETSNLEPAFKLVPLKTGVVYDWIGCGKAVPVKMQEHLCNEKFSQVAGLVPLLKTEKIKCTSITVNGDCNILRLVALTNDFDENSISIQVRSNDGDADPENDFIINERRVSEGRAEFLFEVPSSRKIKVCIVEEDCRTPSRVDANIEISSAADWCRRRLVVQQGERMVHSLVELESQQYFLASQTFDCSYLAIVALGGASSALDTLEALTALRCNEKTGQVECQKQIFFAPSQNVDECDGEEQEFDDFSLSWYNDPEPASPSITTEIINVDMPEEGACDCWCIEFEVTGLPTDGNLSEELDASVVVSFDGVDNLSQRIETNGEHKLCGYMPEGVIKFELLPSLKKELVQVNIKNIVVTPIKEDAWDSCLNLATKKVLVGVRNNPKTGTIECKYDDVFAPCKVPESTVCMEPLELPDVTYIATQSEPAILEDYQLPVNPGCEWCLVGQVDNTKINGATITSKLDGVIPLTKDAVTDICIHLDPTELHLVVEGTLDGAESSGSLLFQNMVVEECEDKEWEEGCFTLDMCKELQKAFPEKIFQGSRYVLVLDATASAEDAECDLCPVLKCDDPVVPLSVPFHSNQLTTFVPIAGCENAKWEDIKLVVTAPGDDTGGARPAKNLDDPWLVETLVWGKTWEFTMWLECNGEETPHVTIQGSL